MKEAIIKILVSEFSHIYCHNCNRQNDRENCDDCHRKSMGWSISETTAGEIADKIIGLSERSDQVYWCEMTEEDKRSIAKYMNLHTYPKFDWNEEASRFAEGITGSVKWDMNFAALCVKEMQKRGDWQDFVQITSKIHKLGFHSEVIACLFNAENFFAAMAQWLKEVK